VSDLKTYVLSILAIGINRKPIAVDSLIEKPCPHGLGRHPFRDLSGLGGFPSIIGCRVAGAGFQPLHRGSGGSMYTRKAHATTGSPCA
jgi:hypothetical protein